MNEDDAKRWIETRFGALGRHRIQRLVDAVIAENANQNLIAQATLTSIWTRHVVDSAQLIDHAAPGSSTWLDIGTGAGFPGLAVAILSEARRVTLVEPRRRRAHFLQQFVELSGLSDHAIVRATRAQSLPRAPYDIISARAVASIADLFAMTTHLTSPSTTYLLLRGANVAAELETAQREWHGMFHVEPSITNPGSGILIARKVRRR